MKTPAMPRIHTSIVSMLEHTAAEFGDRPALIEGDLALTYEQLRRCSAGFSRRLRTLVPAGARVATILRNSVVAALAPYAIAEAGCVHVPLNPLYTARELGFILADSRPAVVLVDDAVARDQQDLFASLPGCRVLLAGDVAAELPDWAMEAGSEPGCPPADPQAIALVQYTGGSTGRAKGVLLSHRAINTNIAQREALLPVRRGTETVLCVMPLFHSYAMAMGLYLSAYSGSTMVILPGYHPERLLDAIGSHRVTIFPGSPTIFVGLMNCEQFPKVDWSRVHTCYSGSAPLSAETLERWERQTGSRVYEGYGQTEAGPVLAFNPAGGPTKVGSVGVPLPATDIEIVDLEHGSSRLPAGQWGEIRARGPQVMAGYLNLPEETCASLRDGWLYTGDIGELDGDGYLFIRDRKKDLVIVGGYNVYPREVEEVLYTHPAVLEAAVVGQPDAYRGEVLRAYVALRPGGAVTEDDLLAHCKGHLAKYKLPAAIEFLPSLPKTAVNKIDKKPLKELGRGLASTDVQH